MPRVHVAQSDGDRSLSSSSASEVLVARTASRGRSVWDGRSFHLPARSAGLRKDYGRPPGGQGAEGDKGGSAAPDRAPWAGLSDSVIFLSPCASPVVRGQGETRPAVVDLCPGSLATSSAQKPQPQGSLLIRGMLVGVGG